MQQLMQNNGCALIQKHKVTLRPNKRSHRLDPVPGETLISDFRSMKLTRLKREITMFTLKPGDKLPAKMNRTADASSI